MKSPSIPIYINDTTICWARRQPKQIRNFTDNFNFSENHRKMAAWMCLVRVWLYLYSFDAWHRNKTNIIWKKELKHLTSAPNFPNEVIVLSIFGGSHAVLICGPNKVNIRKFNYVQHQTGRFKNYSPYKHQKWDCFRFTIDKLSVLDTSKMYYHKVEITALFFWLWFSENSFKTSISFLANICLSYVTRKMSKLFHIWQLMGVMKKPHETNFHFHLHQKSNIVRKLRGGFEGRFTQK